MNNVKVAFRNLQKHKLFALVNILGLAIGLTIFVFGNLLVRYEATHDAFFENADRTYILGAETTPEADFGIERVNSVHYAVGPIIDAELADVEMTARTIVSTYLVRIGEDSFYEQARFADPTLLQIFDFDYLHGDASALDDPSSILITRSIAMKYFGEIDVVGEVVTLDNRFDFYVSAVIEDLPRNSHFNSLPMLEAEFELTLPIQALVRLKDFDLAGDWSNLSLGNVTYVLLPETLDGDWLQAQLDSMFERVVPDEVREYIASFWVIPLIDANLSVWDVFGLPVVTVVALLSFLVLVVACVNYTNLAVAQSLGRSREVGMRKTMGAERGQLLLQFLVESLLIATIAMLVALAILEVAIPLFNNATGKSLSIGYLRTLPGLVGAVVLVGVAAGLYPAWLITRASPIDALRDSARRGRSGARIRAVMIGAQFAISAFMLAIVSIVYMQNEKVKEESYEFPRSEIYTLQRLNVDDIRERLDTLRLELEALPVVDSVGWSSQVPYEQSNTTRAVARQAGDEAGKSGFMLMRMSPEFLATYDIPLLAGRNLDRDIANDEQREDSETVNVLVNEMAVERLGFASAVAALNERFYNLEGDGTPREFVIVGVVPTQNITGLFNSEKPWMFVYDPRVFRTGSLRIATGNFAQAIEQVEEVWKRVIPDYPMQGRFLDEVFDDVYNVLKYMNFALAGFAFVALSLALIGLFGLAAFMAAQRTKEIGVRKVLGASSLQIAGLLVWQFSKPVMWALLVALPLAYFASSSYLNFFADRIEMPFVVTLVAGFVAVLLAWATVAGHALRIARANPVRALRYE